MEDKNLGAKPQVSFEEFSKLDIRMGKVLAAEKVEHSDKLLKLIISFGIEERTIVSGVAKTYSPETMVGKLVPVVINLAPRNIKGIESNGMVIFAINETVNSITGAASHTPIMLNPEQEVPPGSIVQ